MLPRPSPHRAFGVVRLSVTTLLAIHVFISAWLVATVEGRYTEGKPAPTEAHSLVAIDKDRTMIDVEIRRATSFFFYTLERDADAAVPESDNGSSPGDSNPNASAATSEAEGEEAHERAPSNSEERAWLDLGRQSVRVALVLMVLGEALMFTGLRWRHHLRTLGFLSTIAAFAVVFPACYMLEVTGGLDDEDDAAASNTPGANLETVTFVHTNASSNASLTWLGFELKADFSGYDLGLVAPENRTEGRWEDRKVDQSTLGVLVSIRVSVVLLPVVALAYQCRQRHRQACCRVGTAPHHLALFLQNSFLSPRWHPFHPHGAA